MGLFGSLMRGLGFKGGDTQTTQDSKPENVMESNKYAGFDATLGASFPQTEFNPQADANGMQFPSSLGTKNLIIYAPKNNNDIKILVDCLRKKEACIVNLVGLKGGDAEKVLQFLSGAVYALKGSIKRLQGDLFLMTPEGVSIKTQTKK